MVSPSVFRLYQIAHELSSPGLTSKGASLAQPFEVDRVVAVHAENKELACAVALAKMSSKDIQEVNKGMGLENIHVCSSF